jgi:hydroxyacylglutathione hydrolase
MFFRHLLNDRTACPSCLFGCNTVAEFAIVDAHADLVDEYISTAEGQGARIAAVIETHVQAEHLSSLPDLVARVGDLRQAAIAPPIRRTGVRRCRAQAL